MNRIKNERLLCKKELPPGFIAKPVPIKDENGNKTDQTDWFTWICGIPGKENTIFEGYTLTLYLFFP